MTKVKDVRSLQFTENARPVSDTRTLTTGFADEEQPPIPEHWARIAQVYRQIQSPLHPAAEDIATMEHFVADATALSIQSPTARTRRALLLGVTPAIATMQWPQQTVLVAVDQSKGMIQSLWPGDRPGVREARQGDWLDLAMDVDACSIVIGDGSFNCVQTQAYPQLVDSVARVLHDDGLLVLRAYIQPQTASGIDELFQRLFAGGFHTFDGFKFLLSMTLVDEQFNVAVRDVWQHWSQANVDKTALCAATGWSIETFETIAYYENSPACYSYPPLHEIETQLARRFERIDLVYPSYPLGECCPIMLLRKKRQSS